MEILSEYKNLTELLQDRINNYPQKVTFEFVNDDNTIDKFTYLDLHIQAQTIAYEILKKSKKGDRVLLLYPPSLHFVAAFWACIYAGVIAIPASLPLKRKGFLERLKHIIECCSPVMCLTHSELIKAFKLNKLIQPLNKISLLKPISRKISRITPLDTNFILNIPVLATNTLKTNRAIDIASADSSDSVFLQFSSGSTDLPKGIINSHRNILANLSDIASNFRDIGGNNKSVLWLPHFHDMGLAMEALFPVFENYPVRIFSPLRFIKDPLFWLEQMSEYKATFSAGPNFAYDLCVKRYNEERVSSIDLSNWNFALNGAETIHYSTLKSFVNTFSKHGFKSTSFTPCYGLAECAVYVSLCKNYDIENSLQVNTKDFKNNKITISTDSSCSMRIVSCGDNISPVKIKIVDTEGNILPEGTLGKIVVRSSSIAEGYWNSPEETQKCFAFKVKNDSLPHLDTGDLGFIYKNNLFVTGREKELIVINGKNYFPQWIEKSIQDLSTIIRKNCIAVFQITEISKYCIIIALEIDKEKLGNDDQDQLKQLAIQISNQVRDEHEVHTDRILFLAKSSLQKTTSGKIPRKLLAEQYHNNLLTPLYTWHNFNTDLNQPNIQFNWETYHKADISNKEQILTNILLELTAAIMHQNVSEICSEESIITYLNDSLQQLNFISQLENILKLSIPSHMFFDKNSIKHCVNTLINLLEATERSQTSAILSLPLLPMQEFMLQKVGFKEFNNAFVVDVLNPITIEQLGIAVEQIVSEQPYLQSCYHELNHELLFTKPIKQNYSLQEVNINIQDDKLLKEEIESIISNQSKRIDFRKGPLFSLILCHIPSRVQKLVFTISHFVVDPYGMRLFFKNLEYKLFLNRVVSHKINREIKLLHEFFSKNRPINMAQLINLNNKNEALQILANENWYSKLCSNCNYDEINVEIQLDHHDSEDLKRLSAHQKVKIESIILALFMQSFYSVFKQSSYLIQIQNHGRSLPDNSGGLTNIIAWLNMSFPAIFNAEPEFGLNSIISINKKLIASQQNCYLYNYTYYKSNQFRDVLIPPDFATIEFSYLGKIDDENGFNMFRACRLFKDDYHHGITFDKTQQRYRQIFVRPYRKKNCIHIPIFFNKHSISEENIAQLTKMIYQNVKIISLLNHNVNEGVF